MSTLPGTAAAAPPAPSGSPLVVRTHAIPDPGALLALLPNTATEELVSWVRHREGLVGWGRAAGVEVSGPDRFEQADAWWREAVGHAVVRDEVGQPGSGPVVFGSLPFADDSAEPGVLVVPEVVVGRRGDRWWVTTIGHDAQLPPIPLLRPAEPADPPLDVRFADGALSADDWKGSVGRAVERINAGELDKVVLARDLQVRAVGARSTRDGCSTSSPTGTSARGRSRSPASSARHRSCWSAATRAWSSRGSSPARSGAPATTPATSRSPRRSPAPARTSRSTSMRFARSPTRSRRTAPR